MLQIKNSCSVAARIFISYLYMEEIFPVITRSLRKANIKKVNNKNIFQWKICNKENIHHLCNVNKL